MYKVIKFWGIIAIVAVIGFSIAACDGGGAGGGGSGGTITVGDWTWSVENDIWFGGTSTITMTQGSGANRGRLTFSGNVWEIPDQSWGFAGCIAEPNDSRLTSLKSAIGISFKCKGDGKSYQVEVRTSDILDYIYYRCFFTASEEETTVIIPYSFLTQPFWGDPVDFNTNNIETIVYQALAQNGEGAYSFTIWDLQEITVFEPGPTSLTNGQWAYGQIASVDGHYYTYSFGVTAETTYYVWWNDSYDGNDTKSGDILVYAEYSDGSAVSGWTSEEDDGWTTPKSFTATKNGTVYLMVRPYGYSSETYYETYGIVYSTTNSRPTE